MYINGFITYSHRYLEFDWSKECHVTFDIPFDQPLDVTFVGRMVISTAREKTPWKIPCEPHVFRNPVTKWVITWYLLHRHLFH